MITKVVHRNISKGRESKSDNFKVEFKDRSTFDVLLVEITREKTGEKRIYAVLSKYLSATTDSIHFYFSIDVDNDKLSIRWDGNVSSNIKEL